MPVGGFIGAVLTLIIVWRLAQKKGSFDRSRLLIAGVIVGMFFSAGISLIMYLFQKDTMIILGTLMGNLGHIFTQGEWHFFLLLLGISVIILVRLYFRSTALDIMSGGDIYAGTVGIDVQKVRKELFLLTSLLVGITVSYAGIIGFVGLIIPHIVRFFIPSGQRKIFLYSLISGSIFLLGCDLIASAIGCPFFIWLLLKK
jgi:iron complex transport system permease protein